RNRVPRPTPHGRNNLLRRNERIDCWDGRAAIPAFAPSRTVCTRRCFVWNRLKKICVAFPTLAAFAFADCAHPARAAEQGTVRVAAASDLNFPRDDFVEAFRRERPAVDVLVPYGSSGNFYAQLSNRAPFDIFFSADVDYPRRLIRQGLALADSEFLYG